MTDLVGLALRHNSRRTHLLVSSVFGKYLPTDPAVVYGAVRLLGAVTADRSRRRTAALLRSARACSGREHSLNTFAALHRRLSRSRYVIAVGAAHRDQVAAIRAHLGVAGAGITVDTANRPRLTVRQLTGAPEARTPGADHEHRVGRHEAAGTITVLTAPTIMVTPQDIRLRWCRIKCLTVQLHAGNFGVGSSTCPERQIMKLKSIALAVSVAGLMVTAPAASASAAAADEAYPPGNCPQGSFCVWPNWAPPNTGPTETPSVVATPAWTGSAAGKTFYNYTGREVDVTHSYTFPDGEVRTSTFCARVGGNIFYAPQTVTKLSWHKAGVYC
ncbi:phosphoribosyltransferase domain-containing protein [Micromonospora sp. DT233]|uniref:phosphoribosyltransferase domain-containing protein n=1 Tax=Micromonospora sp. DT233 TaxID=3393432 RepID=UPI003CFB4602